MSRFKAADLDKDNFLTVTEYCYFVHPDNYEVMNNLMVQEVMGDMDTNKDAKISREEFVKMHS